MYSFWGKASSTSIAHHLLMYHCLDVGATYHFLIKSNYSIPFKPNKVTQGILPNNIDKLLIFFAILHDIGKFAPSFQHKRADIVRILGGPTARRHNEHHHTHLGKAIFFDHRISPNWKPSIIAPTQQDAENALIPLADAAFGHHGKPTYSLIHENLHLPQETIQAITTFINEIRRIFLPEPIALPEVDDFGEVFKPVSWLFSGLLVLSDWIASGDHFPYVSEKIPLEEYWAEHAVPQAQRAVTASGILPPAPSQRTGFHDLLPHLNQGHTPTPLQQYALTVADSQTGARLLLFEDVTGAGKTEAALLAAHALMTQGEAQGLYIGLPTMATANGMYARLVDTYRALFADTANSPPSLMLAHGARSIHDVFLSSIPLEMPSLRGQEGHDGDESQDVGAFCAAWLADNRKKALLAPCGVGTLDQALLAVLPSKHQCLRLLGLSQHVLIADEVHAYDPYTTRLLERLLFFHAALGGSAILLSATLPRQTKQALADAFCAGAGYDKPALTDAPLPLATQLGRDGCQETAFDQTRSLTVDVSMTASIRDVIDRLLAVHAAGGCSIFICNTVDRAVAARDHLANLLPKDDVLLFHARFALCDRLTMEERVMTLFGKKSTTETRRGKILVATQVAEQSLDLDGDVLVTDLAPMELIIQRAGRCQRHAHRRWRPEGFASPSILVLSPRLDAPVQADWGEAELGNGLFVYPAKGLLWRTARLLAARQRLELPRDARELVEGAYDEDRLPTSEALRASDLEKEGKDWAQRSLAQANLLHFEQGYGRDASAGDAWIDDRVTPTRLGEERVALRLLRVTDDGLRPWAGPDFDAKTCARSEVSVPLRRAKGLDPEGEWRERLERVAAAMPDKGRWAVLTPLIETETPGQWQCALPGARLVYSVEDGLRYE